MLNAKLPKYISFARIINKLFEKENYLRHLKKIKNKEDCISFLFMVCTSIGFLKQNVEL